MSSSTTKVKVTFTEQQMDLLEKLRKEGTWGDNYGTVISNIVHQWVMSEMGTGSE